MSSCNSRRIIDLLMQYIIRTVMHHLTRFTLIVLLIVAGDATGIRNGETLSNRSCHLLIFCRGSGSLVQDLSMRLILFSFTCQGCNIVDAYFICVEWYCINN